MVKYERNIFCTVCGKKIQQPLVFVVPQPLGTVGIQSTMSPSINASGTGAVYPSSPSQHPPPNPAVHMRPNAPGIALGIPQSTRRMRCHLCPHLGGFSTKSKLKKHNKRLHPMIHKCTLCSAAMTYKKMRNHTKNAHGISWKAMRKLAKKRATTANNRKRTVPDCPSAESSDGEEQLSSEDEESPSSDDEGHLPRGDEGQSSSEDEQRPPPEGKGKRPAQNNWQSFSCNLCPDTFLTAETLTMHTKFVHCWRCGYCRNLPPFSSVSLWREVST
ncbi:hypothetical protein BDM02DRAFT_1776521 [Thelephora ganbajun]|uniref:Uncharacterized protein n=1 Tax=Thelephora ganbajun TaxID=370292 RepID=A0ACB6ZJ29_THEGA|nr:hypothetical protein BDM02DRAFT_1776521 [Thelephora ganbajun]